MKGTIRDIRTGLALGKTSSLSDSFINHIQFLLNADPEFYVVFGPIRHSDLRFTADKLGELGIAVVRDRQFPPDTAWIFAGYPEELGFSA